MQFDSNHIKLEAEVRGGGEAPPVLFIMGLGMQLTAWPDALLEAFVARGFRTIAFDNRDIGLSTHFDQWGPPNLLKMSFQYAFGLPIHAPYLLDDMADDAVGLLDALGIARAHVVGASMGGMITQLLAARYPQRVATATMIMTTTGSKLLPGPTLRARRALLSRPAARDIESLVDHGAGILRVIGSPRYPAEDQALRERIARSVRRSYHPQGMARQLVAISASKERSRLVQQISRPALVIHGRDDPLVPAACGIDLARRIPGAELMLIDGMGHDLPQPLLPELAQRIAAHCGRG